MRRARRLNRHGLPGSSESAVLLSNDLQAESTLNLDFRTGILDPRIDFQRTTTGTYYRGPFNQNLFRHSQDYTQAVWQLFATGTGILPVVTANAAIAPDGTMTANRVVMNRGNGTTASDRSAVLSNQGLSLVANAPYTLSVWMRGTVGGEVVTIRGASATDATVTLTTAWQRFSFTANALSSNPAMWLCGNVATTSALQVMTIEVWGAQVTEGSLLTPYIPTTTAAITQGQIAAAEPWNLCIRSEEVNLWPSLLGATVTANAIVAPDGNTTADMVVEDTSTGQHRVLPGNQALGGTVDSSVYAISVYLKAGTRTRAQVGDNAQVSSGATWFDLSAGTVLSGTGTIVDAGNGWWRCTVFPAKSTATNSNPQIALVSSGTNTNYTGDGTSGLYVWGLQVNLGTSALPYRSTTTTALWLPRFENDPVTGAARGLLIEGGTTNVVTGSSGGTGITITTAAITSPTGVVDGIRALKSDTTTPRYFRWDTTVTPTVNTTYTASMFVKRGNVDMTTSLEFNNSGNWGGTGWIVNFSVTATGVTVSSTSAATATVQDVGNGWYRVTATFTTGATAPTANGLILCKVSGTTNDFIYFWGGQLEAQSFASSYIPTTTATVARGADSALMTGTNFSSWYNQAEGTLLTDMTVNALSGERHAAVINAGNNQNLVFTGTNVNQVFAATRIGGTVYADVLIVTSLGPHKSASAYTQSVQAAAINGIGFADTATPAFVATMTQIHIGNNSVANAPLNGTISRLAYWPTRLPNETLQALTT
jgi:hypothetical protein